MRAPALVELGLQALEQHIAALEAENAHLRLQRECLAEELARRPMAPARTHLVLHRKARAS